MRLHKRLQENSTLLSAFPIGVAAIVDHLQLQPLLRLVRDTKHHRSEILLGNKWVSVRGLWWKHKTAMVACRYENYLVDLFLSMMENNKKKRFSHEYCCYSIVRTMTCYCELYNGTNLFCWIPVCTSTHILTWHCILSLPIYSTTVIREMICYYPFWWMDRMYGMVDINKYVRFDRH